MATSGSTDFTLNRDQLIRASLRLIGAETPGETPSSEQVATATEALQVMIKNWATHGIQLWVRQQAVLLPIEDKIEFTLSDASGSDHATTADDLVKTEIRVAASATDTTIEVDSTTDMAASDTIGIELDDDTMHYTTISSITDTDTLVIASGIPSGGAAAADNHVYAYTNKLGKPLRADAFFVRLEDDTDVELFPLSDKDYRILADKDTTGTPNQYYYRPERDTGRLFIYPGFDDMKQRVHFLSHRLFEDMDAAADNFDFPVEWLRALKWSLARELLTEYGVPEPHHSHIKREAESVLAQTLSWDMEQGPIYFGVDFEADHRYP